MEKIPRGIILALLIGLVTVVTALGIINYFAPVLLGLERDTSITALFCLVAGIVLRFVLPSKKDDSGGEDN